MILLVVVLVTVSGDAYAQLKNETNGKRLKYQFCMLLLSSRLGKA